MDRIEKIKEYLAKSPGDNFLQHALALEYIKIGDDQQAKSLFIELLSRDPSYTGSYYHIAKLCERTGDLEAAREWYSKGKAVARAANDQHALNELAAALNELEDPD